MSAPMGCRLIGRWRIVAADIWERDYLDLCGPAMLDIGADGHGEIAFGASGSAELLEHGSPEIEFERHHGDEAILKAVRDTSSAAC